MLRTRPLSPALALLVGLAFALFAFTGSSPAFAKKKDKDAAPADKKEEKKDDDSPFKDWDKTLKDVETKTGFFTLHKKHDNIWLELTPDQLDKPFLLVSSLSSGLGKGWLLGGMPLDTDLWVFHRAGNKLQLLVKNSRFRAADGTPMSKAVALSYGDSVLASAKIVSVHKDDHHVLIDLNDIIVADLPGIGIALKQFLGGPASFDKDRSAITAFKVFPKNVEIEMAAVFISPEAKPLESVSDPRFLPIGIHYSLSELPSDGYQARFADDRVGYFNTVLKDFSRDSADTFFVRYINRWQLEKQDPSAALSPPKEPIVYYLDRTIPEEYRTYVRDGILMWNKAFEKAGFKDAMVVKDAPDDPDFDAEDVRYNTIRWITSTEPSFGAIGPSRVDPRNGHILDADILVEAAMVQNARRGYRNYVNTLVSSAAASPYSKAGAANATIAAGADWLNQLIEHPERICNIAEGAEINAAVGSALMQSTGEIAAGGPVPDAYIGQFLHWVISHEVGHTLGLRHNFRASAATPMDKLHDVSWTREHGLYDSVMEYPPANIALDRGKQGDYYSQTVGDYDLWAIQYGYTPFDAKTSEAEIPSLAKIAELSTQPGHEFGTDEDAFSGPVPFGIDPGVNQFDLGADPVAYGRDRIALITSVRGRIQKTLTAQGEGYDRLRNTFDSLLLAQSQVLSIVSKQVGGVGTSRAHRGDPGEKTPLIEVPADRQRDAMAVLAKSGFSDEAWAVPPETLASLQRATWLHWGTDMSKVLPFDYPYSDRVLEIQTGLLDRLMSPIVMARIQETEIRVGAKKAPYTLGEHMRTLTDTVFAELGPKAPAATGAFAISPLRRNLGRETLARLVMVLNSPPMGTPEDARSLARANLMTLDKRIGSVMAARGAGMDESTRAYLDESRARIKRALAAQSVLLG